MNGANPGRDEYPSIEILRRRFDRYDVTGVCSRLQDSTWSCITGERKGNSGILPIVIGPSCRGKGRDPCQF